MEVVIGKISKSKDKVGGIAAFLCAIHCAALPFIISFAPAWFAGVWGSKVFGVGMVVFSTIVALWAMYEGFKKHKNCWPIGIAGAGLLALIIGELVMNAHGCSHTPETMNAASRLMAKYGKAPACSHGASNLHHYVNAGGGVFLAIAHFLNHKLCKTCHHGCKH